MKIFKRIIFAISIVLIVIVLVVTGYAVYLTVDYSRIEDNFEIEVLNTQEKLVKKNEDLIISSYNIGFGAYSQDFSFFMDGGSDSVAKDEETVYFNTEGAITEIIKVDPDFAFFQEVDQNSTRSKKIDQSQIIRDSFPSYSSTFALNFNSGFLMYPIFEPHGSSVSGIETLSKYKIESSLRRQLPVDDSWPTKFFDLDRAINIHRLKIENENRELVLINVHLSAYDKGGKIRLEQMEFLKEILSQENELGNYVVLGGDFNHDLLGDQGKTFTTNPMPDWVATFPSEQLPSGYTIVKNADAPSVRSTDVSYVDHGKNNFLCVVDGFITSSNIKVISSHNIDTDFMFSDHNPVTLTFRLS